jgi:hypothetical protein
VFKGQIDRGWNEQHREHSHNSSQVAGCYPSHHTVAASSSPSRVTVVVDSSASTSRISALRIACTSTALRATPTPTAHFAGGAGNRVWINARAHSSCCDLIDRRQLAFQNVFGIQADRPRTSLWGGMSPRRSMTERRSMPSAWAIALAVKSLFMKNFQFVGRPASAF